jgi:hypothetical protein
MPELPRTGDTDPAFGVIARGRRLLVNGTEEFESGFQRGVF